MHEDNVSFIKKFIQNQDLSLLNAEFKLKTFFDMCVAAYKLAFGDMEIRLKNINGILSSILNQTNVIEKTISLSEQIENIKKLIAKNRMEEVFNQINILFKANNIEQNEKNNFIIIESQFNSLKENRLIIEMDEYQLTLTKLKSAVLMILNNLM